MDPDAAERAGGVGLEPDVDAFDVEAVLAFGKEAEELSRFEPVEADRALEPLPVAGQRSKPEHWEGLHDGAADARAAALRGGETAVAAAVAAVVADVALAVLGVEEEEEGEGEYGGEHAYDDGDARTERRCRRREWGRGVGLREEKARELGDGHFEIGGM